MALAPEHEAAATCTQLQTVCMGSAAPASSTPGQLNSCALLASCHGSLAAWPAAIQLAATGCIEVDAPKLLRIGGPATPALVAGLWLLSPWALLPAPPCSQRAPSSPPLPAAPVCQHAAPLSALSRPHPGPLVPRPSGRRSPTQLDYASCLSGLPLAGCRPVNNLFQGLHQRSPYPLLIHPSVLPT